LLRHEGDNEMRKSRQLDCATKLWFPNTRHIRCLIGDNCTKNGH
jgi:hypothetical protein